MTLEGGMCEAMAVEGATATDAQVFEAYVEGFSWRLRSGRGR
jgi:hypothetical protein